MHLLHALILIYMCVVNTICDDIQYGANNFSDDDTLQLIANTTNCTTDDFNDSKNCLLVCTVSTNTQVAYKWLYRFYPRGTPYNITDFRIHHPGDVNATLMVNDYRAGYYECYFTTDSLQVSNNFHFINSTAGSPLGGPCWESHQCGTLNSVCKNDTHRCACPSDYPVQSSDLLSPVCLPLAYPGQKCLNDQQCSLAEENFVCVSFSSRDLSGYCQCILPYVVAYIDELNTRKCIKPGNSLTFTSQTNAIKISISENSPRSAALFGYENQELIGETNCLLMLAFYQYHCNYNEECVLTDPNSECSDGYCDCIEGYYYSESFSMCQYDSYWDYLSMSATIGIVISIVVLICIIFGLAMVYIRSSTRNYNARYFGSPRTSRLTNNNLTSNCNNNPGSPNHPMDAPPSYCDVERSETPPPPFDSAFEQKVPPDDQMVAEPNGNNPPQDMTAEDTDTNGSTVSFQTFVNPTFHSDC